MEPVLRYYRRNDDLNLKETFEVVYLFFFGESSLLVMFGTLGILWSHAGFLSLQQIPQTSGLSSSYPH